MCVVDCGRSAVERASQWITGAGGKRGKGKQANEERVTVGTREQRGTDTKTIDGTAAGMCCRQVERGPRKQRNMGKFTDLSVCVCVFEGGAQRWLSLPSTSYLS